MGIRSFQKVPSRQTILHLNGSQSFNWSAKRRQIQKTAQSRLTCWADNLLPFDFTVGHLPGKDIGFVDYLSRHPSSEPVPVSLDDENFVIFSVNQISTLLGFDHLMPRYSWPQIKNKFSQQVLAHDVTQCNTIGQSIDHLTSQEIEREKRIVNDAETFQAIFEHLHLQCAKIYIHEWKSAIHLAKLSIFQLTIKL